MKKIILFGVLFLAIALFAEGLLLAAEIIPMDNQIVLVIRNGNLEVLKTVKKTCFSPGSLQFNLKTKRIEVRDEKSKIVRSVRIRGKSMVETAKENKELIPIMINACSKNEIQFTVEEHFISSLLGE